MPDLSPPTPNHKRKHFVLILPSLLGVYCLLAYIVIPFLWKADTRHHPALAGIPTITHTASGIPGDPLNIALIGSEEELEKAMLAAKWYPADPITLKSSLRIAADTVFHRTYDDAPVSDLFLFGRKQDLAFEQPVGPDPKERHHVRFWRSEKVDSHGRPLWIGSATFDIRVGLSHTTGQITHHISPNVDSERDRIIEDLEKLGRLSEVKWIDGFQKSLEGKNGGGDPYHTDGRLAIGVLTHPAEPEASVTEPASSPNR